MSQVAINFFLTVDKILQEKEELEADIEKYGEPSGCLCADFHGSDYLEEYGCNDGCHCEAVNYVQELFPVLKHHEKILNEYLEDWYDICGTIWEIKNVITWSKPEMKRHEEIFQKYSWTDEADKAEEKEIWDHIIEVIQMEYNLETDEANYGQEDGGWFKLILKLSEGMTKAQHQELAEYFASTVEDVKWD